MYDVYRANANTRTENTELRQQETGKQLIKAMWFLFEAMECSGAKLSWSMHKMSPKAFKFRVFNFNGKCSPMADAHQMCTRPGPESPPSSVPETPLKLE
jgi:hypothetical protein